MNREMLCIVSKYHLQDRNKTNKKNPKTKQKAKKKTKHKKVMLYHTTCLHLFVPNGLILVLLSAVLTMNLSIV